MRRLRADAVLPAIAVAALWALTATGPSWAAGLAGSPWPMFQHDPQHTGRTTAVAPSTLELEWRFQVQGEPASPAIGLDGTIYLPSGDIDDDPAGFLYAINPDGTLRWRFAFPPSTSTNCVIVPGVTTPAVADDGTIFVHTQSGRTIDGTGHCTAGPSFLYAINPDGTQKCRYQFNFGAAVFQSSGISSPAIGPDGTVYATSLDTGLHAINPADCTFDWIASPEATSISSSPAIGPDGTIYFMIADLHAYEPDGDPKWTAEIGNAVPNHSSPSIGADGTIYACGLFPTACHALSPAGSLLWSFPLELPVPGWSTPAIAADGTIYLPARDCANAADSCVHALNPDGSQRWRVIPAGGAGVNHSVVVGGDGHIYARGDLGISAEAAGFSGSLYGLNPADGSESDRHAIPAINQGIGELNPAIGSDGTLYVPEPHNAGTGIDPNDQHLSAYVQSSGGSGTDTTDPKLVLRGRRLQRLDSSVEVGARLNEAGAFTAGGFLLISVPPGREGLREAKQIKFRLKRDRRPAVPGKTVTLKLQVPRKARALGTAALRDFRTVVARAQVTAADASGNETTKTRRITFTGRR